MNFLRDVQRGFARKLGMIVAGLVVAALLSLCGIRPAYAAYPGTITKDSCPSISGWNCSKAQAWQACSLAQTYARTHGYPNATCADKTSNTVGLFADGNCTTTGCGGISDKFYSEICPVGQTWVEATHSCDSCDTRPPLSSGTWVDFDYTQYGAPMTVCSDGCSFMSTAEQDAGVWRIATVDGVTWTDISGFVPLGSSCTAGSGYSFGTPPPDSDHDGTSDGNDGSPNNPGATSSGNSNGDGNGDGTDDDGEDESTACGGEGQPECPADGSGKGSGNGNTSGGGGDCSTRPTASGDAIAANILFQTWSTRCALEGNAGVVTGDPTSCSASYSCQGDQVQCAQVNQLRALICKDTGVVTGPSGDANGDGQPDWTQTLGAGDSDDGSAAHAGESAWGDGEGSGVSLDGSGFGFGTTCPEPPQVFGQSLDWTGFCTLMGYVGLLVLAAAHMHALYIFAGD